MNKSRVSAADYLYKNALDYLGVGCESSTPPNYPKARRSLMGAASCGHGDAAVQLALMSLGGHGITNELAETLMWFQIAKLNNPDIKLGSYKKHLPKISDKMNSIAEFRAHDWLHKNPPNPDVLDGF